MKKTAWSSVRSPSLPSWKDLTLVTAAFALGVVLWGHFFHAYFLGQGDTLPGHLLHIGRDTLLMFPMALLVFAIGLKVARSMGMVRSSWHGLIGSASLVAIVFILFMVPGVGLHDASHLITDNSMDNSVEGAGPMSSAEATDHAEDDHSVGESLRDEASHGLQDGSVSLVAALPLALLSLFLLARRERRTTPR